jgi:hypothetical protein
LFLSKTTEVYFLLEMLFSYEKKIMFLLSKAMPPENRQKDGKAKTAGMSELTKPERSLCQYVDVTLRQWKMQTEFVMCIMKQLSIRRFFSLFTLEDLMCS